MKFNIKLDPVQLADQQAAAIKETLLNQIKTLYRRKEIEFPVQLGMVRFMSDRAQPTGAPGHRYDREGLMMWCRQRFTGLTTTEEDFRTQVRSKIQEKLLKDSEAMFPSTGHDEIDDKIAEAFSGTMTADEDDAKELADWFLQQFKIQLDVEHLTDMTQDEAREYMWDAFDLQFRPEMRRMERSLLLNQLDTAWKNHLYTMDHLRSTVGLRGYAQEDPKIVYKREGMKEFDAMWEGVEDKISDLVFRMEEEEGFQETLWSIGSTVKEAAAPVRNYQPAEESIEGQQKAAIENTQTSEKKKEPIRNRAEKVGRNDPCPCGSGRKYKVCHMGKVMR
jgi:preprotein translocase subunit SecA